MIINEWKGGADEQDHVVEITIKQALPNLLYRVEMGSVGIYEYRSVEGDTIATVTAALAATLGTSTAWSVTVDADTPGVILLTGTEAGKPMAKGITGSNPAASTVTRLQAGRSSVTKQIDVTLPATTTGGTWTLAFDFGSGDETVAGIAHNETPAQLATDIASGMASATAGDVGVELLGTSPRSYRFTIGGNLTDTDPTCEVDATLLTGNASVSIETVQTIGSDVREVQVLWFEDTTSNGFIGAKARFKYAGDPDWGAYSSTSGFTSSAAELKTMVETLAVNATVTVFDASDSLAIVIVWDDDSDHVQIVAQATSDSGTILAESEVLQEGGGASQQEIWHATTTTQADATGVSYTVKPPPAWFTATKPDFLIFDDHTAVTDPESNQVTVLAVGAPIKNEKHRLIFHADAGAITLNTHGGGTTGSIVYNVTAGALETLLLAQLGAGNATVGGGGTESSPFIVEYIGAYAQTDVTELAVASSTLTGGINITPQVARPYAAGQNEQHLVRIDPQANGGTLLAGFSERYSSAIAYDADDATWTTRLTGITTIGAGNAAAEGTPASLIIEYLNDLGNQPLPLLVLDQDALQVAESTTMQVSEVQAATGPTWWNNAKNWTLAHVPTTGEVTVLGSGNGAIQQGLVQAGAVTVSGTIIDLPDGDLVDGQIVRLSTTDTFPTAEDSGGAVVLSDTTDYYVVTVTRATGGSQLIEISETANGEPIEFTDAGTGTLIMGVALASFQQYARFTGKLGWPRRDNNAWVDQQRYLCIRLLDPVDGTPNLELGIGAGTGSSQINLQLLDSYVDGRILQSGNGRDTPAINILNDNLTNSTLLMISGALGLALEPTESAAVNKLQVFGGQVTAGNLDCKRVEDYVGAVRFVTGQASGDVVQLRKN